MMQQCAIYKMTVYYWHLETGHKTMQQKHKGSPTSYRICVHVSADKIMQLYSGTARF
jgi:hypothetical protein